MKQNNIKQNGFGTLEIVVICFVILVIGAAGFLFFARQQSKGNKAATSQGQTTTQTQVSKSDTLNPQSAEPAKQYLVIKEWGIKFPLSDDISDVYYTTERGSIGADGVAGTAWVGLTSLNASGCDISKTGPSDSASPVGSIIRVSPDEQHPVTGELYTEKYPGGSTINNHYYAFAPWTNRKCGGDITAMKAIDASFTAAVKAAEKTSTE
jgi:Tfp pilus assembly protein PilV